MESLIATIDNENEIVNSLRLLKESERQRKNEIVPALQQAYRSVPNVS
jgi:hypothetical protein